MLCVDRRLNTIFFSAAEKNKRSAAPEAKLVFFAFRFQKWHKYQNKYLVIQFPQYHFVIQIWVSFWNPIFLGSIIPYGETFLGAGVAVLQANNTKIAGNPVLPVH